MFYYIKRWSQRWRRWSATIDLVISAPEVIKLSKHFLSPILANLGSNESLWNSKTFDVDYMHDRPRMAVIFSDLNRYRFFETGNGSIFENKQISRFFMNVQRYQISCSKSKQKVTRKAHIILWSVVFSLKTLQMILKSESAPYNLVHTTQCGNFRIFLSLRFYVKSILGILEVQNQPFLHI